MPRISGKQIAIFGAGKLPGGVAPVVGIFGATGDRCAFGEVSDGVGAVDGEAIVAHKVVVVCRGSLNDFGLNFNSRVCRCTRIRASTGVCC